MNQESNITEQRVQKAKTPLGMRTIRLDESGFKPKTRLGWNQSEGQVSREEMGRVMITGPNPFTLPW